jgi:hypothetical protein
MVDLAMGGGLPFSVILARVAAVKNLDPICVESCTAFPAQQQPVLSCVNLYEKWVKT